MNYSDNVLDLRDLIARFEELESVKDNSGGTFCEVLNDDMLNELQTLAKLLVELQGNGGDEQWRGDWYPLTMIRADYFTKYAQELAEECDMVKNDAAWPHTCIDWEKAARELKMDYSIVDFNGATYLYR